MAVDGFIGKTLTVTRCTAFGKKFANLKPGSKHLIVAKPESEPDRNCNGCRGWWVMGVGEPVMLLFDEIEEVL